MRRPRRSTLFPYTTLFRSGGDREGRRLRGGGSAGRPRGLDRRSGGDRQHAAREWARGRRGHHDQHRASRGEPFLVPLAAAGDLPGRGAARAVGGRAMRIAKLAAFPADVDRARGGGAFGSAERDDAAEIVRAVRGGGDAAVLRTVRRFDHAGARPDDLVVEGAALRRAARGCPHDVRRALDLAYTRIRTFHERQRPRVAVRRDSTGELRLVPTPLERVGALVPRGKASYPSTVLMTGVPSQVAGVRSLAVASPMPADGSIDPAFAYALHLVGATALYRPGGAAAVAEAIGRTRTTRVRGYRARELSAAVRAANDAAPEHVLLAGRRAAAFADRVCRAGGLFVGVRSAVAFGDYVAGTNHSLPTGGTARWSSALRVDDFVRWTSRVSLRGDLRRLARAGSAIARPEGMPHHAASVEVRPLDSRACRNRPRGWG